LLWWMRRLLALRKRWRAFGEGKCEFLHHDNRKVLAYVLRHEKETLLVVANLSRFVQTAELDLSAFKSRVPVELFGLAEFPVVTERPYFFSLGPHAFYWFSLETRPAHAAVVSASELPAQLPPLVTDGGWEKILNRKHKAGLEAILPAHLKRQRWFAGRNRNVRSVTIREIMPVPFNGENHAILILLQVDYSEGDLDFYTLPLAQASGAEAKQLRQDSPQLVIAGLQTGQGESGGILYEATGSRAFCRAMLELILNRRRLKGSHGEAESTRLPALRQLLGEAPPPESSLLKTEQSHTSVLYGDKVVLKLFRQFDWGVNPEFEIGRFLSEKNFPPCAPLTGALEYADSGGVRTTLAVVSAFIPQTKNALDYTLDALSRFYERVTTLGAQALSPPPAWPDPGSVPGKEISPAALEHIGTFVESARLLGQRTAELHLTLASDPEDKNFAPEPFVSYYQRSLFQSMRNLTVESFWSLRRQFKTLPPHVLPLARRVVELKPVILQRLRQLSERRLAARRIRIHGNFQLSQILWTGKDFVFLGFEGDVATPITERAIKRSPLRDVASMVRSLHYAARAGLYQHVERGNAQLPLFEQSARYWHGSVSAVFLQAYFERLGKSDLLPADEAELRAMLQVYLLNQMLGELVRELEVRPDKLNTPLEDILHLLGEPLPPRSETAAHPVEPGDAKQMP